jgi:hypothetical protein
MEKIIELGNQKIVYNLKNNKKSRRLRLTIYNDGCLLVTKPVFLTNKMVDKFLLQKADWIIDGLKRFKDSVFKTKPSDRKDYLLNKKAAFSLVIKKIEEINKIYNFKYGRISIRNQKTHWGSCSRRGNLNFNYKIVFLSEELAGYIIAHELCHLKEMNHSSRFWNLVLKAEPNYLNLKKELKKISL